MIIAKNSILNVIPILVVVFCTNCTAPPPPSFTSEKLHVLSTYYSPQLMEKWRNDARRITAEFPVNIFSACQYGEVFITGSVSLGDVFDPRISSNFQSFLTFAKQRGLIRKTSPCESYARFAKATGQFMDFYGYQTVLYNPDEFHPLFTTPQDCWLFVYEPIINPNSENLYYSLRGDQRRVLVSGGAPMKQVPDNAYCSFYIPAGLYKSYDNLNTFPSTGYQDSTHINHYEIPKVTSTQLARRDSAGLVASPFSKRTIRVGRWVTAEKAYRELQNGFSFSGVDSIYTWSDVGFYALPLDSAIWAFQP